MCSPAKQPERGRTLAAAESVTHQQQSTVPPPTIAQLRGALCRPAAGPARCSLSVPGSSAAGRSQSLPLQQRRRRPRGLGPVLETRVPSAAGGRPCCRRHISFCGGSRRGPGLPLVAPTQRSCACRSCGAHCRLKQGPRVIVYARLSESAETIDFCHRTKIEVKA